MSAHDVCTRKQIQNLNILGNIEILARTRPGKIALMWSPYCLEHMAVSWYLCLPCALLSIVTPSLLLPYYLVKITPVLDH